MRLFRTRALYTESIFKVDNVQQFQGWIFFKLGLDKCFKIKFYLTNLLQ